ncbi:MAG TPA: hypothetical protein VKQ08_06430 [Cyclobacteriaceae bacterium]|nr:hypothetical protein [Cyclobacteriaceae bacterium]
MSLKTQTVHLNVLTALRRGSLLTLICFSGVASWAQNSIDVNGKAFTRYSPNYFRPHRGLFYTFYLSPVVTVDPLALGGKSTYAIALGSRIRIWENYSANDKLGGLKMKGIYTAFAYEYYPQQYSKTYISLWARVQNFLPIAFKGDLIYAQGYGLRGFSTRYGIGIEVKSISIFLCGELYKLYSNLGLHPNAETPYTNAGEILAIIPIYDRKGKRK